MRRHADGAGLGELAGRAFRIGHLGDLNEGMLLGALGLVELRFGERDRERAREQRRECKRAPGRRVERVGDHPIVRAHQHHEARADALAVIAEHRRDRVAVARRDRLAERVIGGQHARFLQEPLRLLVEQPIEDPRAGDQLVAQRPAGGRNPHGIDQQQAAELDRDQQRDEERHDPASEAAEARPRTTEAAPE